VDSAYYSARIGRGPLTNPTINDVARALTLTIEEMWKRDYMQEWHGLTCVDAGRVEGRAAMPLADHIEVETGWRSAWPLLEPLIDPDEPHEDLELEAQQAEDMLFDLIEYFHRHISKGIDGDRNAYHGFSNCGWHYNTFDPLPAQVLFRQRMNRTLINYGSGFRISESSQLEHTADEGLDQLIDAVLPTKDPDIAQRVAGAIALYRNRGRTGEDLRLAVRDLFDVLEKLRPELKKEMLKGDESTLFNIANNFAIRHLNDRQMGNYDSAIWHEWMFYVNLSTVHAITHLMNRKHL
jgi:hypothetical protein